MDEIPLRKGFLAQVCHLRKKNPFLREQNFAPRNKFRGQNDWIFFRGVRAAKLCEAFDMRKNSYDDDDGRVVADMSGVERQPMVLPRFRRRKDEPEPEGEQMSREDRMVILKSAIGASLLIGGIFIAAGALVIWILTMVL